MQEIVANVTALAVAMLYYFWRDRYQKVRQQRRRILCQRVAYLLWIMAERISDGDSVSSAT
jgi:hypothetical protein